MVRLGVRRRIALAIGGFLIFLGLIIIGFFITFFGAHRRLWIRVDEQEGKSRISIAATSTKDPVGLGREVGNLMKHISSLRP